MAFLCQRSFLVNWECQLSFSRVKLFYVPLALQGDGGTPHFVPRVLDLWRGSLAIIQPGWRSCTVDIRRSWPEKVWLSSSIAPNELTCLHCDSHVKDVLHSSGFDLCLGTCPALQSRDGINRTTTAANGSHNGIEECVAAKVHHKEAKDSSSSLGRSKVIQKITRSGAKATNR